MKIKNIISLLILSMSCTMQTYFDIPLYSNGNVIILDISVVTSTSVTIADDSFTIDAFFPNPKSSDLITTEVLKQQVSSWIQVENYSYFLYLRPKLEVI